MKTSIIICTYNEEKTIADVVSSICNLKQRIELLITKNNNDAKKKLDSLQHEINLKLQDLKEKMEELR